MSVIKQLAEKIMQRLDTLATISQSPNYLDRRYLTPEHKQANALVASWMQEANMRTWQDSVGNVWGRYESPNVHAKSLLMGSHLDTVINGGKYDGMLGVIAPIALIDMFSKQGKSFPFHIDIVGFCDEEGTRFGTTLLGSRALTGKWQNTWAELRDENKLSLRQAMHNFELSFDDVAMSQIDPSSLLAYVELHIEQGPVLEAHKLPTGIVSGISGAKRFQIYVTGMAGHAGTVPMHMRNDALAGTSEMVLAVERIAAQAGVVATVGFIENKPNAVNVISGSARFSLDIRSDNDERRDQCLAEILKELEHIAQRRKLGINVEITHSAPAVLCDKKLIEALTAASIKADIPPLQLLSGAGHDAMAMADICPIAMLFTRCYKGISHHPAESIQINDVAASLNVLLNFIENFQE